MVCLVEQFQKVVVQAPCRSTSATVELCWIYVALAACAHHAAPGLKLLNHFTALTPGTLQGTRTNSIISETQEGEHARLRKAFSSFYSASNLDATLAGLTHEVAKACDAVSQQARASADGVARVNILDVTNDIIASVVGEGARQHAKCHLRMVTRCLRAQ